MPLASASSVHVGGEHADVFLHVQAKRAGKIKGESSARDHVDDIVVLGWTWGVSAAAAIGSTSATSRRLYNPLVVSKGIDTASTGLLNALATNDELREAKLSMRKGGDGQTDYFSITLKKARLVGVALVVDADGSTVETVQIAFNEVEVEYRAQKDSGTRGAAYTFSDQILAP